MKMPWWGVVIVACVCVGIGAYGAVLYIGHGMFRNS
jgi:hypothetical protein